MILSDTVEVGALVRSQPGCARWSLQVQLCTFRNVSHRRSGERRHSEPVSPIRCFGSGGIHKFVTKWHASTSLARSTGSVFQRSGHFPLVHSHQNRDCGNPNLGGQLLAVLEALWTWEGSLRIEVEPESILHSHEEKYSRRTNQRGGPSTQKPRVIPTHLDMGFTGCCFLSQKKQKT